MSNNNKKWVVFAPIILSVLMVGSYLTGRFTTKNEPQKMDVYSQINSLSNMLPTSKFGQILSLIDAKYVDNVDIDTLSEEYIGKMLHKLDPHSAYIPAKDAVESNEHLQGEFDGIGVMFNMATDTAIIQSVISGGPSQKVGVLGGDRIITVGDSIIAGRKMPNEKVIGMLKGKGGTTVTIGVERFGVDTLLHFDIVRGKIPIKSIDAVYMVNEEVGYIKLLQFARTTHEEFTEAVEKLRAQGMKKLIFDLTGNSGGYLDQAILIANEFLPKDKMIVYTQGRKSKLAEQYSDGNGRFQSEELVVMIDEGSASASEIVAGALQDNDRGTLVGRRSFGKGLVQQQIPFNDGSLMNLTIARYHTPTGRSIQRPYDNGYEEYYQDLFNRYVHSEMLNRDSIKLVDSLEYTTPKGKIVYGGGGIMPDEFVPMDTTLLTDNTRKLLVDNTLFYFTLRYTDKNRKVISSLDTMDKVKEYFEVNGDKIYEEFLAYARTKRRIGLTDEEEILVKNYIFSYLARNCNETDDGFYYYFNRMNEVFNAAVEIIVD
ncbi:MAG: S41 family peptidase [Rikenellaceae bacterium]